MTPVPPLPAGTIHLWLCRHAARQPSEPTLRRLLAGYLPDARPVIERAAHGRPQLAPPHDRLRFSLSHSGDWLLAAIARDLQPGVDLERQKPLPNAVKLARRFFDPVEAEILAALPPGSIEARFHAAWTAREAVLKALGRGLAFGLDRLAFEFDSTGRPILQRLADDDPAAWQVHAVAAPDGYRAALAWRGPPAEIVPLTLDASGHTGD